MIGKKHQGLLSKLCLVLFFAMLFTLNPVARVQAGPSGDTKEIRIPLDISPETLKDHNTMWVVLHYKWAGQDVKHTVKLVYGDVYEAIVDDVYKLPYLVPKDFGLYGIDWSKQEISNLVYLHVYLEEKPKSTEPDVPVVPGDPGGPGSPVTGTDTGWQSYDPRQDQANCYVTPDKVKDVYAKAPETGAVIVSLKPVPGTTELPSKAVVNLPLSVLETGGRASVPSILDLGSSELVIEADILETLKAQVQAAGGPLGTLQVRIHTFMDDETKNILDAEPLEGHERITPASKVTSIGFVAVDAQGKETSLTVGSASVAVRFDPKLVENPEHVNLYRIGSLVYVSGKVVDNSVVATVKDLEDGRFIAVEHTKTFDDVKEGYWGKPYVDLMASKYVVQGRTKTTFAPEATTSRAEFVTMLVRTLGLDEVKPDKPTFSDVNASDWHYGYVESAHKAGLAKGDSGAGGPFRPDDTISREEMAALLVRAFGSFGIKLEEVTPEQIDEILDRFSDCADVSEWARQEVAQAAALGLIEGHNTGEFAPRDTGTRVQAATMMTRWMKETGIL